jgi:hypothetical protein
MFRHTALFLLRPATTAAQRLQMLHGLESLRETCPTVRGLDYGEHILDPSGGSYDVALHLDFDDADGYAAYVADPGHVSVSEFNASVSQAERTARVDWVAERPLPARTGRVHHCSMFVWAEGASRLAQERALGAAARLGDSDGVVSAVIAEHAGNDPRASDWILDLELADAAATAALLDTNVYAETVRAIAPAIDAERTATVTHLVS